MTGALRALMANTIDYAGLFPPAALSMEDAVAEYRKQRRGSAAWMVGTFVVPIGRLDELAATDLWRDDDGHPQRLSVIGRGGEDEDAWAAALEEDYAAISAFLSDHRPSVEIASYEVRLPLHTSPTRQRGVPDVAASRLASLTLRASGGGELDSRLLFLEIPATADAEAIRQHVSQIAAQAAGAKLRMGDPDGKSVPSVASVAVMIDACRRAGIRWKATAGLHHAMRSTAGGERHGFLNLLAATVLASAHELSQHDLQEILGDENAENFDFDNDGLRWRDVYVSVGQIEMMRREGLTSFGSCSIAEPWDELQELGLVRSLHSPHNRDDANDPMNSFIPVSKTSHFPIQNLPYGVFRPRSGGDARVGVAIGEFVLDLAALERRGLMRIAALGDDVFAQGSLNRFMALGPTVWSAVRKQVTQLLREDEPTLRDDKKLRAELLFPIDDIELLLPVEIGDYTDFYSSRYHAENVGTMMRGPDNALQENWLHLPVAYHGRASSIVVSGTDIRRPQGQVGAGKFQASRAVDFELEAGFFVGPGSPLGQPISIDEAQQHIFGMVLVNDWSARDIQKWEYVPLGPFLSKNFATSISPWVVTMEALEPFRTKPIQQDPQPLPYLQWKDDRTYDIELEVHLTPAGEVQPQRIVKSNFRHLYWTMAQQLAHHAATGCNMRTGDLLASGTISGPEKSSRGCLLELTWRGEEPVELSGGGKRTFLEDGDRVTISGYAQGDGYRVGFGEVAGTLLPART